MGLDFSTGMYIQGWAVLKCFIKIIFTIQKSIYLVKIPVAPC